MFEKENWQPIGLHEGWEVDTESGAFRTNNSGSPKGGLETTVKENWQPIHGAGVPDGAEVDTESGAFRINRPDSPEDDGSAGDPEPRKPESPPDADEVAREIPVDENV